MNRLFTNIKVDREERPDIDQIYMAALHHLGEHGGWPLTMFLTSDGEPVWGGTYFPQGSRYGRPFRRCLERSSPPVSGGTAAHRAEPRRADEGARRKSEAPRRVVIGTRESRPRDRDRPAPSTPSMAASAARRSSRSALCWSCCGGPACAAAMSAIIEPVARTLAHMSPGRHLRPAGRRLFPLFGRRPMAGAPLREDALRQRPTSRPACAPCARPASRCSAPAPRRPWPGCREMTRPEGAFCAHSMPTREGEEGKFYVWSLAEIDDILGRETIAHFLRRSTTRDPGQFRRSQHSQPAQGLETRARAAMDIPAGPIPDPTRRAMPVRRPAPRRTAAKAVGGSRPRVRPGLDDKVLPDRNGLVIAALADAGAISAPRCRHGRAGLWFIARA